MDTDRSRSFRDYFSATSRPRDWTVVIARQERQPVRHILGFRRVFMAALHWPDAGMQRLNDSASNRRNQQVN